jgi:methionyl aminopeptidase
VVIIKSKQDLINLRKANRIVGETLQVLKKNTTEGITTIELDRIAESYIRKKGGKPAFKGYSGFPATLCISINDEVVHGIPGSRKIKKGDIVSIDVGAFINGFFGDAAITVGVGEVGPEAEKLMRVTKESLYAAIKKMRSGRRLAEVSLAVQKHAEANGFSVVRDFVGHGIGMDLHEDPQIPNFHSPQSHNPRLKEGMVFAIEPMVNAGTHEVKVLKDGWTAVTLDKSLSAHFEHTVAVTSGEPWILSDPDEKYDSLPS